MMQSRELVSPVSCLEKSAWIQYAKAGTHTGIQAQTRWIFQVGILQLYYK